MKLNDIDFGFIIINLDRNYASLKTTYNSIKSNYKQPIINVVDNGINPIEFDEMEKICTSFKSKESSDLKEEFSIASALVNTGIKNSNCDWNFIVVGGSWVRPNLKRKFDLFVKSEKDILFPIIDRRLDFPEATINGMLIHKKAMEELGDWPTKMWKANSSSLYLSKFLWYVTGIDLGYNFKGIVGMRIS